MRSLLIISDIDGSICHHINGYDANSHPGWEEYANSIPIWSAIEMLQLLSTRNYELIFMTWRPETIRELTTTWLSSHFKRPFHLFMREDVNDYRSGAVVKHELFMKAMISPEAVRFVLEDDAACVEMWRSHGLDVLQVHAGVWK